jgi:uncharacterized iron-regulated membrane protein
MATLVPLQRIRKTIVPIHRWLSLALVGLWLLQALTGMLIVFHWEIDDASMVAPHAPTNPAALERRIALLAPVGSGRHLVSAWTSAGFDDRYDLTIVDKAGNDTTIRVSGDGTPIRIDPPNAPRRLIDSVVVLHQSLIAGQTGRWIIGASGILLFTNLLGGIVIAWPRRGTWLRVLRPSRRGAPVARHFAWHRAVGLIGVLPALALVGAGALLAFDDSVSALMGASPPEVAAISGADRIGFARAVTIAEQALPGSRLAAVTPPQRADATYQVRLRTPGEWRRAYGASFVFVDATVGRIRGVFPEAEAPFARKAFDALFPVHTGEAGGFVGRLLVLFTGLWLASMIVIGARLWWLRRTPRRKGNSR